MATNFSIVKSDSVHLGLLTTITPGVGDVLIIALLCFLRGNPITGFAMYVLGLIFNFLFTYFITPHILFCVSSVYAGVAVHGIIPYFLINAYFFTILTAGMYYCTQATLTSIKIFLLLLYPCAIYGASGVSLLAFVESFYAYFFILDRFVIDYLVQIPLAILLMSLTVPILTAEEPMFTSMQMMTTQINEAERDFNRERQLKTPAISNVVTTTVRTPKPYPKRFPKPKRPFPERRQKLSAENLRRRCVAIARDDAFKYRQERRPPVPTKFVEPDLSFKDVVGDKFVVPSTYEDIPTNRPVEIKSVKILINKYESKGYYPLSIKTLKKYAKNPIFSRNKSKILLLINQMERGMQDDVQKVKKTDAVVMNSAAYYLATSKRFPPKILQKLKLQANFYIVNMSYEPLRPRNRYLRNFMPADFGYQTHIGFFFDLESLKATLSQEKNPHRLKQYMSVLSLLEKCTSVSLKENILSSLNSGLSLNGFKHPILEKETYFLEDRDLPVIRTNKLKLHEVTKMQSGINVFHGLLEQFQELPSITRLIMLIVNIFDAKSFKGVFSALGLYMQNCKYEKMVDEMIYSLVKECTGYSTSTVMQSNEWYESLKMRMLVDPSSDFVTSEIGGSMWKLLSTISLVGFFTSFGFGLDSEWIMKMRKHWFPTPNGTDTFVSALFSTFSTLATRLKECYELGSFQTLFSDELSPKSWFKTVDCVCEDTCIRLNNSKLSSVFKEKKAKGDIPKIIHEPITESARLDLLKELVKRGDKMVGRFSGDPVLVGLIRARIEKCRKEAQMIENSIINSNYRVQGFFVYIAGEPGVGKSNFVTSMHAAFGNRRGYSIDPSTIYRFEPGQNFWDKWDYSNWWLLFDDADTKTKENPGDKNFAEHVLTQVNNAPTQLEQAAVDNKGRANASWLAGAFTSNFYASKLEGRLEHPLAFWRRFPVHIHMKVNKKYATEAGSIDPTKAYVDGNIRKDTWIFDVRHFDANQFKWKSRYSTIPYGKIHVFTSVPSVIAYLLPLFDAHIESQLAMLKVMKEISESREHCPICCLPESIHRGETCVGNETIGKATTEEAWTCEFNHDGWIDEDNQVSEITQTQSIQQKAAGFALAFYLFFSNPFLFVLFIGSACWQLGREWFYEPFAYIYVNVLQSVVVYLVCKGSEIEFSLIKGIYKSKVFDAKIREIEYYNRMFTHGKDVGKIIGGLLGGSIAIYAIVQLFRSFKGDSEKAQLFLQGRVEAPTQNFIGSGDPWARISHVPARPYIELNPSTYTPEELITYCNRSLVTVKVNTGVVNGIDVGNGYVLTMGHVFNNGAAKRVHDLQTGFCTISRGDSHISFRVDTSRVALSKRFDLALVYAPEVVHGKGLFAFLPPTSQCVSQCTLGDAKLVVPTQVMESDIPVSTAPYYVEPTPTLSWKGKFHTSPGDCGSPLIGRFSRWFGIVGLHGTQTTSLLAVVATYAEDVSQAEVTLLMNSFKDHVHMQTKRIISHLTPDGRDPIFTEMVPKSSLSSAFTQFKPSMDVYGTLTNCEYGNTMKTRVERGDFSTDPEIQELEREVCGETPYYMPPVFKGEMKDYWEDPYTRSIGVHGNVGGNWDTWMSCVEDYFEGADNLMGFDSVIPLSDYEVVAGREETTIPGFDLSTSLGLPFNQPKKTRVRVNREDKTVEIHPRLMEMITEITDVCKDSVYMPITRCVLKDEALSKEKIFKKKVRVFKVMPFAYNFLLKKYFAPLVAFVRNHPDFFETVIGVNIASPTLGQMIDYLKVYDNFIAFDAVDFDVRGSTFEILASSCFVDKLLKVCSYTDEERTIAVNLFRGAAYTINVMVQEVYELTHTVPSGIWITLFLNCIRTSLQMRYAFKRLCPNLRFRDHVRLRTLGDDVLGSVSYACESFNQIKIAELLATEIGAPKTSSVKGRELVPYEKWEDVTFLKRAFVEREGLWLCPIEKKTIVKMLVTYKIGQLSRVDQHAVALSNALAESFMWGREFHARINGIVQRLVREHGMVSSFLRVYTYEESVERYRKGWLNVWNPLGFGDDESEETGKSTCLVKTPLESP